MDLVTWNDMLPIDPKWGLYLRHLGLGGERLFAKRFRATWNAIWIGDRELMNHHWHSDKAKSLFAMRHPDDIKWMQNGETIEVPKYHPRIELLPGWSGGRDNQICVANDHRGEVAAVFGRGHILRFHAPLFDIMPSDVAEDVIARELVRVFQYFLGKGRMPEPEHLEEHTNWIMDQWGFDPESVDWWAREQGVVCIRQELSELLRADDGPGREFCNGDRKDGQSR